MRWHAVTHLAHEVAERDAQALPSTRVAEIQHVRNPHLAREETARTDQLGPHSLDRLNQVPVRLDGDRISRTAEIEHWIGPFWTPSASGRAATQRSVARGGMALKYALDRDGTGGGNGHDGAAVRHLHGS